MERSSRSPSPVKQHDTQKSFSSVNNQQLQQHYLQQQMQQPQKTMQLQHETQESEVDATNETPSQKKTFVLEMKTKGPVVCSLVLFTGRP